MKFRLSLYVLLLLDRIFIKTGSLSFNNSKTVKKKVKTNLVKYKPSNNYRTSV